MKLLPVLIASSGLAHLAAPSRAAVPAPIKVEANRVVELRIVSARTYAAPFRDVRLDITFVDPQGRRLRVPAFWDGGRLWKVRYASPVTGVHRYFSEYPAAKDPGLHSLRGTIKVRAYAGNNPLLKHGPLRVNVSRRYLEHVDGQPFFWLGDTWWMGLCHRLHFPNEFGTLVSDRVAKGFTVVQIVAGLYPDMPPFDPRGANEAGFPWDPQFRSIRPEYFDAADRRINTLVANGLTPCIVGAWGYFMPLMGEANAELHWRYLVARYGALPVVWCVAGEANLPYYRAPGFPFDDRKQVKEWTDVARYLRSIDPFHRPTTIHPTGIGRLSSRNAINELSLIDFDMLQTPHGQAEAVAPTISTVRASYADRPVLPVINGEASYEMLNDSLPTEWTRRMFWICMMNGAAGHTYGANGIWQCNRRGEPHGLSPTGGTYGKISWDEAMRLPGSMQEGLGKRLLLRYPWQRFRPHPEWCSVLGVPLIRLDGSQWIWFSEGNPARDAPVAKRYFRRAFSLPSGVPIESARLRVSADDACTIHVNGVELGSAANWKVGRQFDDIARFLHPGPNIVAVEAENSAAPVKANPAGFIAALEISVRGQAPIHIITDAQWHASREAGNGWTGVDFDDSAWTPAQPSGDYGSAPWGSLDGNPADTFTGPQTAGIPGVVRVTYVQDGRPVIEHGLRARQRFGAYYFDPTTGVTTPLPGPQADLKGDWICPPPPESSHDWVVVLHFAVPGTR